MSQLESQHTSTKVGPKLVFTLVHGTFAKGADWVTHEGGKADKNDDKDKKKSHFRAKLREALNQYPIAFDDGFSWGHEKWRFRDNSEDARWDGKKNLERHLLEITKDSCAKHFVIAHSHGGNVALYALKNEAVRKSIDGLACLATPFLFSRRRPIPFRALALSVFFLAILLYVKRDIGFISWWLLTALILVYVGLILHVAYSRYGKGRKVDRYLDELSFETLKPGRLLVIRPSGDEASGLLRTSQFASWVLGKILARLDWLLGVLISVGIVLTWGRHGAEQLFEWLGKRQLLDDLYKTYGKWLDLDPIFGAVLALVCLVVVLMALQRLSFSFNALGRFADVETLAEDAPPGMTVQVVVLRPADDELIMREVVAQEAKKMGLDKSPQVKAATTRKLAHTDIYNKPETVQEIAKWVEEILASKEDG